MCYYILHEILFCWCVSSHNNSLEMSHTNWPVMWSVRIYFQWQYDVCDSSDMHQWYWRTIYSMAILVIFAGLILSSPHNLNLRKKLDCILQNHIEYISYFVYIVHIHKAYPCTYFSGNMNTLPKLDYNYMHPEYVLPLAIYCLVFVNSDTMGPTLKSCLVIQHEDIRNNALFDPTAPGVEAKDYWKCQLHFLYFHLIIHVFWLILLFTRHI